MPDASARNGDGAVMGPGAMRHVGQTSRCDAEPPGRGRVWLSREGRDAEAAAGAAAAEPCYSAASSDSLSTTVMLMLSQ